jgi:hypothetical protein
MRDKKARSVSFRARPEIVERLEYAEKLGLTPSFVLNSVLQAHLKAWLERTIAERAKLLQAALKQPVP